MEDHIKELVAIGASVACNCHPCIKYHKEKAVKLGIQPEQIQDAIEVGKMVRQGAANQMDEYLNSSNK